MKEKEQYESLDDGGDASVPLRIKRRAEGGDGCLSLWLEPSSQEAIACTMRQAVAGDDGSQLGLVCTSSTRPQVLLEPFIWLSGTVG